MKRIILAALIVFVVSPALGKDGRGFSSFYGYAGLDTCGVYVKANRSGISKEFIGWMRGYMSATNQFVRGKRNFFEGVDADSIFLWIEQWCLKNPTSSFGVGINQFLKTRGAIRN